MFPFYRAKKSSTKKKCFIYKKKDGSDKELDLNVNKSFLLQHLGNKISETHFPLEPINFTDDEMCVIYKCVLYSYLAYKNRSLIEFPPEVKLEFEKLDSSINRIPFFIVSDSTINSIVLSCRGSSCLDDFITDSLGNGVSYDGGKFHQGVFSTASYVFMQCQNKLIELNELLNNSKQENDDDDESNLSCDHPEIDFISSSEFDDSMKEEEDDTSIESMQLSHKSSSNIKLDLNEEKGPSKSSNNLAADSHEELNSEIYEKMIKNPTKIIITGHSLGAAVASVVAYLFKEKFPELNVQCICFAPPPTLTLNLWRTTEDYIKSFMIEGDPVPFMSVQNLISFSDFLIKHEHANKVFKKLIHNYLNKKSIEEFEANSAMKEPFYPPGQMYLIKFTKNKKEKTLIEKQKEHIKQAKEELKKKFQEIKEKNIFSKKDKNKTKDQDNDNDNDDDDDNDNEGEKVELKDGQIQLCHILNPDYFLNLIKNYQEKNHFIKNYTKLMVRLLNKTLRNESHPQ